MGNSIVAILSNLLTTLIYKKATKQSHSRIIMERPWIPICCTMPKVCPVWGNRMECSSPWVTSLRVIRILIHFIPTDSTLLGPWQREHLVERTSGKGTTDPRSLMAIISQVSMKLHVFLLPGGVRLAGFVQYWKALEFDCLHKALKSPWIAK